MRERLEELLGAAASQITVATFHAFCLDMLRRFADSAGLPEDFTVVDQTEEATLLRSETGMTAREAKETLASIGEARREMKDASAIAGYAELTAALAENRAISLDSIVPRCVRLLREHGEVREKVEFRWICIDEYQDIDHAQYELVRTLCPDGRGLCVIGDPDQAIYSFRGADMKHFLRFSQDYADAKVARLTRNYRSSPAIVDAAGQVVQGARTSMSVAARSVSAGGIRIRFHQAATAAAEAEFITHQIEKLLGGTALFSFDSDRVADETDNRELSFGDIAVLVRLKALLPPLEKALTRLGLPVQSVSEQPFVDHPGAREILQALRASYSTCLAPDMPARNAIAEFADNAAVFARLTTAAKTALEQCVELARLFPGTLRDFLDHLLLRRGNDLYDEKAERVALMTLHAAKGLEFPVVFIAACEDGILPYTKPDEQPDLAEECRLLYVGMTRAEQLLYITSARKRTLFGKTAERIPSPFVKEIEAGLRDEITTEKRPKRPSAKQLEFGF